MKTDIIIFEQNLTVGRIYTMYNFGDYLKGESFDVTCFYQNEKDFTLEEYLRQGKFLHLTKEDFVRIDGGDDAKDFINQANPQAVIANQFNSTILTPDHYHLFVWVIIPYSRNKDISPQATILTNAYLTRQLLYLDEEGFDEERDIIVTRPTIDYSIFREHAKPWDQRDHNLVAVTRTGHGHEKKNTELLNNFDDIIKVTDESELVMDRKIIAEKMGNSRIFLHLSEKESAPLVAYESLNAGCHPLFYDTGAIPEQLISSRYLLKTLDIDVIKKRIRKILSNGYDPQASIQHGGKFDRAQVGKHFLKQIKDILEQ